MSRKQSKTLRISEKDYYQLNEISGLFTSILGAQINLGIVASWAIKDYHLKWYQHLATSLNDADLLIKTRKDLKNNLRKRAKLAFSKDEYEQYVKEMNLNESRERDE